MENDMALQKIKLKIGTVYQKEPNGIYYFRYQVNGARKAISLKTRNKQQAIKEAEKHVPLIQATSSEVIAAHVQHARNLATPEKNLLLYQAWEEYEKSPDRATPDKVTSICSNRPALPPRTMCPPRVCCQFPKSGSSHLQVCFLLG